MARVDPFAALYMATKTGVQRFREFLKERGIWTGGTRETGWTALLVPAARVRLACYNVKPDASPIELIATYCRLLEDVGLLINEQSEVEAVRELCRRNSIHFPI